MVMDRNGYGLKWSWATVQLCVAVGIHIKTRQWSNHISIVYLIGGQPGLYPRVCFWPRHVSISIGRTVINQSGTCDQSLSGYRLWEHYVRSKSLSCLDFMYKVSPQNFKRKDISITCYSSWSRGGSHWKACNCHGNSKSSHRWNNQ